MPTPAPERTLAGTPIPPPTPAQLEAQQHVAALQYAAGVAAARHGDERLDRPPFDRVRRYGEADAVFAQRLAALPPLVLANLQRLDEIATATHAAASDLEARLRDATAGRRRADRELMQAREQQARRAQRRSGLMPRARDRDEPEWSDRDVPILEATLVRATADVERLAPRLEAAREQAQGAGRLLHTCCQWVRDHAPEAQHQAVAHAAAVPAGKAVALDAIPAALAALRERIAALGAEREALKAAGVPVAEAVGALDSYLTRQQAEWTPDAAVFLQRAVPPGHAFNGILPRTEHTNFEGFLATLLGEALRPRLVASIEAAAVGRLLLSDAERAERLREIETEMHVATVTEERYAQRVEAGGRPAQRRADAPPVAVLCC